MSEGTEGMIETAGGTTLAPTEGIEPGLSSTGGVGGTMISADSDIDMASSGAQPPPDAGLFACYEADCDVWVLPNCAKGCTLDAAGTCLLEQMRDRSNRRGDFRVCGDACERTALVVRGGGTDEVQRQTATELGDGGLDAYRDLKKCVLRDPAFFTGCIEALTAECTDPTKWFVSCSDTELSCGM